MRKNFWKNLHQSPLFWGMMALITAMLIAFVLMTSLRPNYQNVHQEMSELASTIRTYYRQQPDYRGLNTAKAVEDQLAPTDMRRPKQIISHIGREIIIGADSRGTVVMPSGRTFSLTIENIGKNVCQILLHTIEQATEDPALESLTLINDETIVEFGWNSEKSFDEAGKKAESFCQLKNTLSWTYR